MTTPETPREDAAASPPPLPPPPFAPPASAPIPVATDPAVGYAPLPTLTGEGVPSPAVATDVSYAAGNTMSPVEVERHHLQQVVDSGAGWFFWIVGLSLINVVLGLANAKFGFAVGLGITDLIVAFGQESKSFAVKGIVFVISLIPMAFYGLMGVLGRKSRGALITGAVFYSIDLVMVVVFQQWISAAVHAWALFSIFKAVSALGKINRLPPPAPVGYAPEYPVAPPPTEGATR